MTAERIVRVVLTDPEGNETISVARRAEEEGDSDRPFEAVAASPSSSADIMVWVSREDLTTWARLILEEFGDES